LDHTFYGWGGAPPISALPNIFLWTTGAVKWGLGLAQGQEKALDSLDKAAVRLSTSQHEINKHGSNFLTYPFFWDPLQAFKFINK
jgi:hypothetical protein